MLGFIIIVLLIVVICPIKQWNKGSTTVSDSRKLDYKVGLFETSIKDTRTVCCDASGSNYETTHSDITSDNAGKVKDAGNAAFGLLLCTIFLTLLAVVLVVCCYSPMKLLVGIAVTVIALIFETAAWVNWAQEVGNDDADYGACFMIAV